MSGFLWDCVVLERRFDKALSLNSVAVPDGRFYAPQSFTIQTSDIFNSPKEVE